MKLEQIAQELSIDNPLYIFCVAVLEFNLYIMLRLFRNFQLCLFSLHMNLISKRLVTQTSMLI